jgi:hypothetical protein
VGEAQGRELVAILPVDAPSQGALASGQAHRDPAHLGQHPIDVGQAGRLHHAGDHQVAEHRIAERVEPETGVDAGERVEQHLRIGPDDPRPRHPVHRRRVRREQRGRGWLADQRGPADRRGESEIQNALTVIFEQSVRLLDQQPQLGLVAGRPDMTHDPPTDSAICTAVAPEAVGTRRTHATSRAYGHELVPRTRTTNNQNPQKHWVSYANRLSRDPTARHPSPGRPGWG